MLGRLERNFRSLRRFTADASHELKTPLTVLRSGIERVVTHPKIPPEALEVLEETLGEVNQMAETVDSLLMLARADEGRAPLHLEQLDLREILQDVAETGSILGEQAGVDVEVRVPEGPMWLAADQRRIRQLLMNLLTNAIKYTPAGGNVEIDAAATNGTVTLKVRDTGMGIAPGDLPHIFDRFWRADEARSRTGARPGSGLRISDLQVDCGGPRGNDRGAEPARARDNVLGHVADRRGNLRADAIPSFDCHRFVILRSRRC